MESKTLIIIGLVAVIGVLAVYLFASGTINFGGSKFANDEEVGDATVGIGSSVEDLGSILQEIDNELG